MRAARGSERLSAAWVAMWIRLALPASSTSWTGVSVSAETPPRSSSSPASGGGARCGGDRDGGTEGERAGIDRCEREGEHRDAVREPVPEHLPGRHRERGERDDVERAVRTDHERA